MPSVMDIHLKDGENPLLAHQEAKRLQPLIQTTKNIMLAGRKPHHQTQEGVLVKVAKHTITQ